MINLGLVKDCDEHENYNPGQSTHHINIFGYWSMQSLMNEV